MIQKVCDCCGLMVKGDKNGFFLLDTIRPVSVVTKPDDYVDLCAVCYKEFESDLRSVRSAYSTMYNNKMKRWIGLVEEAK